VEESVPIVLQRKRKGNWRFLPRAKVYLYATLVFQFIHNILSLTETEKITSGFTNIEIISKIKAIIATNWTYFKLLNNNVNFCLVG
jgi:hypothetical protein